AERSVIRLRRGRTGRRMNMATTVVTMQQLLEAGAHCRHQTHRWKPKMKPYIFGDRNGVHIIDLSQSVPLFARALDFVQQTVARGGKVLFVGTKRQAQDPIAEAAQASGQHFVNHRWLGGMLTNWKTISNSIKRLKSLEEQLSGDTAGLTKKEVLQPQCRGARAGHRRNGRAAGRAGAAGLTERYPSSVWAEPVEALSFHKA